MHKLSVIFICLFMYGCAQAPILTGGPKDQNAPAIDSAKTTPYNGQTNFNGTSVEMKFDEFITLNKPLDNIIITPQQSKNPIINSKKKKLTITFEEELLENTTYTITFNNAVQDITEKNDSVFQYVFSTGDYIDSLQVTGFVSDAFTNSPLDEILVGLYPIDVADQYDSILFNNKPMYLAQSNKLGEFKLNYLKGGDYFLFAYQDKNRNLYFNPDEKMAFLSEKSIRLNANIDSLKLKVFSSPETDCYIEDTRFEFPGKFEVILSQNPDTFNVTSNLELLIEETESKDSLIYWLAENPVPKMRFFVNLNGELDTLKPVYKNVPAKMEDVKLSVSHNVVVGMLLPEENLLLTFSEPIGTLDESKFHFFDKDSNAVNSPKMIANTRSLEISTFGTAIHEILIDSAAVQSVYEREMDAKVHLYLDSQEEDYYGSLIINVEGAPQGEIIVELIDLKGKLVREVDFNQKMILKELLPGDYQLRLIFDVDKNGEWTTGDLTKLIQPEKVIYFNETIKVKSKWEKEVDWLINIE